MICLHILYKFNSVSVWWYITLPPCMIKLYFSLSSVPVWKMFSNSSSWGGKKTLGCGPTPAYRASWVAQPARPSAWIPSPPSPLSPSPLVLGSRLPPLTGKTSLEGGLKGLQTDPDRRCLAADVAGWYVTALRSGEEVWWGWERAELETSDWFWLHVQVRERVCAHARSLLCTCVLQRAFWADQRWKDNCC